MNNMIYFLILISLLFLYLWEKRKQIQISRWKKSLNLDHHYQIFQQLYNNVDGFTISRRARDQRDAIDYLYGEIEFLPFVALLSLVTVNKDTVFYDLGSGTGKAVLACAMVYPARKCAGVELFPDLYLQSCIQTKQLATISGYDSSAEKISFIPGDFLEIDLQDATLIFINSTAFFNPTWGKLCDRLNNLPHLDTVITTSKILGSPDFSLIKSTKIQMSWGVVLAHIHTRKTNFH